jgi:hypothetical protein
VTELRMGRDETGAVAWRVLGRGSKVGWVDVLVGWSLDYGWRKPGFGLCGAGKCVR